MVEQPGPGPRQERGLADRLVDAALNLR
jgi:hypothetical protein